MKYQVRFIVTREVSGTVEVEASDQDEADALARESFEEGRLEFTPTGETDESIEILFPLT